MELAGTLTIVVSAALALPITIFSIRKLIIKNNSPSQKISRTTQSHITQQSGITGDVKVDSGTNNTNFIGSPIGTLTLNEIGTLNLNEKICTFSEKLTASEDLKRGIDSFFFSALGNGKIEGFLSSKNLDESGQIKQSCQFSVNREFENAKAKLKASTAKNAPMLDEQDQVALHALLDPLTALKNADIHEITLELKSLILAKSTAILGKYIALNKS